MAIWFFQGRNDFISPLAVAQTAYDAFVSLYTDLGKTSDWISDNVLMTILEDAQFLKYGVTSFHSSIKPTYELYAYDSKNKYGGMISWVLSKRKV
jgi:hypothetical protein